MEFEEFKDKMTTTKRKIIKDDFERKIRTNKRIMSTLSESEINNYLEQGDYEAVIRLVEKVYGKDSADILRERALSMEDIPTFDIFDEKIQEVIGYGGVHTFLTYNMESTDIITEMVNNPQMIEAYKSYKEQIGDFYSPSAVGLYYSLHTFYRYKELIEKISNEVWTDEERENFLLMISDEDNTWRGTNLQLNVTNEEELISYTKKRNRILNERIYSEDSSIDDVRDGLINKYFGNYRNQKRL